MVKKAQKEEHASEEPKATKTKGTTKAKTEKTKRAPSAYNLFIKDKIEELKKSQPDMDHKQRFKAATQAWGDAKK